MLIIVLLILALVCFILAVAKVAPSVNWIALGLALVVLSWLLPLVGIHT